MIHSITVTSLFTTGWLFVSMVLDYGKFGSPQLDPICDPLTCLPVNMFELDLSMDFYDLVVL